MFQKVEQLDFSFSLDAVLNELMEFFFLSIIMFRRRIDQGNGYELRVWRAALRQRHHDRIPADDPAGHKSCSGE